MKTFIEEYRGRILDALTTKRRYVVGICNIFTMKNYYLLNYLGAKFISLGLTYAAYPDISFKFNLISAVIIAVVHTTIMYKYSNRRQ